MYSLPESFILHLHRDATMLHGKYILNLKYMAWLKSSIKSQNTGNGRTREAVSYTKTKGSSHSLTAPQWIHSHVKTII
jgi:hypothetical protein